jgi:hypothetical protein
VVTGGQFPQLCEWIRWGSKFDSHLPFGFVLLGWDRRRAWVAGGDRPSPRDRFNFISGSLVRIHLLGSNFSQRQGQVHITWEVAFPGEVPFKSQETVTSLEHIPGSVQGIAVIEFSAPDIKSPRQATLKAQASIGDIYTQNTWSLWFFPSNPWQDIPAYGLYDPVNMLPDLPALSDPQCSRGFEKASIMVCSSWNDTVDTFLKNGGRAILLAGLNHPAGPLPVVPAPYWREALKLVVDHPAWGDFLMDMLRICSSTL